MLPGIYVSRLSFNHSIDHNHFTQSALQPNVGIYVCMYVFIYLLWLSSLANTRHGANVRTVYCTVPHSISGSFNSIHQRSIIKSTVLLVVDVTVVWTTETKKTKSYEIIQPMIKRYYGWCYCSVHGKHLVCCTTCIVTWYWQLYSRHYREMPLTHTLQYGPWIPVHFGQL